MPRRSTPAETLLERERFELSPKSGGGLLSYEVWGIVKDGKTVVTRYNLAYVNPLLTTRDNGRVLGYDNAHGEHHRHYLGKTEPADIRSYEDAYRRFQTEWQTLAKRLNRSKTIESRKRKRS